MNGYAIPTGGPLNQLNERMKCNAIKNTVKIMQLVQSHRPDDPDQLQLLIEQHTQPQPCSQCGLRSAGTVQSFGQRLYESQFECQGFIQSHREFSVEECFQFMYNLFCVAPLRGIKMEQKSMEELGQALGQRFSLQVATDQEDRFNAVDYFVCIRETGKRVAGVQVKPSSFWKQSGPVSINDAKHQEFTWQTGIPVFYHVYDNHSLLFADSDAIANNILKS